MNKLNQWKRIMLHGAKCYREYGGRRGNDKCGVGVGMNARGSPPTQKGPLNKHLEGGREGAVGYLGKGLPAECVGVQCPHRV